MRRVIRQEMFLGSTIEEISHQVNMFLLQNNICVGNYIDIKLFKRGNVYQYVFIYAELIEG